MGGAVFAGAGGANWVSFPDMKKPTLPLILSAALVFAFAPGGAYAEEPEADAAPAFAAMLTDATLKGSWAPIDGGALGDEKGDGYEIVSAKKKEGDVWVIVSKFKVDGEVVEYPMEVVVKFAGDVAVLVLDDAPTAGGGKYSARVMFHNDVYAGSWWGGEKKGTISGTISRGGE